MKKPGEVGLGECAWPISLDDVRAAEERIRPLLPFPTPLRRYEALDARVGNEIQVLVKHENHQPTNSFKIRNGLSALTALSPEERARGVIAATRGNHGQGVALAGRGLGTAVTICVPVGNNPEKNEAMRGFGAELVEEGRDYDEALTVMHRLARERRMVEIHSTNDRAILAGAGTATLEIVEQAERLDAMVVQVGGGSKAVGAMTVQRVLRPHAAVYAVQAERAPAIYESWKRGEPVTTESADTVADGIATRSSYELTLGALREGLTGFVTVSEAEIAEAMRLLIRTTHNLVEPAAAVGMAGLMKLRETLAGKRVAVFMTGGNVDRETLRRVVAREI